MILRKYDLSQLYYGTFNGKYMAAYYDEMKKMYINISVLNRSKSYDEMFDQKFSNIRPLSEVIEEFDIKILLVDQNGKEKKQLNITEINNILITILRKKNLSLHALSKQSLIAENISNITCDLLGLNSENTPCTNPNFLKNFNINYSIVPAKKLQDFKRYLQEFIKIALMDEFTIVIKYEKGLYDYKILRSLNKSGIKNNEQIQKNSFIINASNDGKILINGIDINDYNKKQNVDFQKIIKF